MEEGVPQDLDLTGGPEAGVELHRVVAGSIAQRGLRWPVGPEIVLQTTQQGVGGRPGRRRVLQPFHWDLLGPDVSELQRRLTMEAAPAPEQRVGDQ